MDTRNSNGGGHNINQILHKDSAGGTWGLPFYGSMMPLVQNIADHGQINLNVQQSCPPIILPIGMKSFWPTNYVCQTDERNYCLQQNSQGNGVPNASGITTPELNIERCQQKDFTSEKFSLSRKRFNFKKVNEEKRSGMNDTTNSDSEAQQSSDTENSVTEVSSCLLSPIKTSEITPTTAFVTSSYIKLKNDPSTCLIYSTRIDRSSIKPNTMFVYSTASMINSNDKYWRLDRFTWRNKGSIVTQHGGVSWRVVIHVLISGGRPVDFFRKEYRLLHQDWESFKTWKDPHVFVLYYSVKDQFQLSEYEEKCIHGNSKINSLKAKNKRFKAFELGCNTQQMTDEDEYTHDFLPSRYVRTSEACKQRIRENLKKGMTPMQAEAVVLNETSCLSSQPEDVPRNRNQVYEIQKRSKPTSTIQDELAEVWKLSFTTNYVPVVKIEDKQMMAVMLSPSLELHIKELLTLGETLVFHYDTTYNIGKFYCSIMCFKHPLLVNEPVIPFGFVFHHSKSTDVHGSFMLLLAKRISQINSSNCSIVSDRENAIKKSVGNDFPLAHKAYCHRHIKDNVMHWKEKSIVLCQRMAYTKDVEQLLRCPSQEEFEQLLEDKKSNWSKEFLNYFSKCLQKDVLISCRYVTEPLGLYYPLGGVSNNASESMNFSFKHFLGKRTPATMLEAIYKSYYLCITKYNLIKQGVLHSIGGFRPKLSSADLCKKLTFNSAESKLDIQGVQGMFDSGNFVASAVTIPGNDEVSCDDLIYKTGLADYFVKTDRVKIVGGQFFVTDLEGKTFEVNVLDEWCTCGGLRCIHYLAVEKITRKQQILSSHKVPKKPLRQRKAFTLTGLSNRAISKKAGKKAHVVPRIRKTLFPILAPTKPKQGCRLRIETRQLAGKGFDDASTVRKSNNDCSKKQPSATEPVPQSDIHKDSQRTPAESALIELPNSQQFNLPEVSDNHPGEAEVVIASSCAEVVTHLESVHGRKNTDRNRCPCGKPKMKKLMIQCFSCQQWFHQSCANISKEEMEIVLDERMWFCSECNRDIP